MIDDASATYANAYFEINYINVFYTSQAVNSCTGQSTSGASGASGTSTLPAGATGDQSGNAAASASNSRAAGYLQYDGPGVGPLWAVVAAAVVGVATVI